MAERVRDGLVIWSGIRDRKKGAPRAKQEVEESALGGACYT